MKLYKNKDIMDEDKKALWDNLIKNYLTPDKFDKMINHKPTYDSDNHKYNEYLRKHREQALNERRSLEVLDFERDKHIKKNITDYVKSAQHDLNKTLNVELEVLKKHLNKKIDSLSEDILSESTTNKIYEEINVKLERKMSLLINERINIVVDRLASRLIDKEFNVILNRKLDEKLEKLKGLL